MSARVHKKLLGLAVSVALYVGCSFIVDIALVYLFGVSPGWPIVVVNAVLAVLIGWRVGSWNDRQDELEEQRSEVDS